MTLFLKLPKMNYEPKNPLKPHFKQEVSPSQPYNYHRLTHKRRQANLRFKNKTPSNFSHHDQALEVWNFELQKKRAG